eukprot:5187036-Pyramimonas_sp.AAC.1
MQSYASNLKPITVDQSDDNNDRPLTPKDIRQLRGLLGALQWPSSQVCPHTSASVSTHQGRLPTATVATARQVNNAQRFYKQNAGVGLKMKKIGKVNDIVLAAMRDVAWGVRQDGSSQGGSVIMACHSKVLDGENSDFC